jgi:hypothetical protein
MKFILLLVNFCRTTRTAYVYFSVYAFSFFLSMISLGISGYFNTGPLWA